MTCFILQSIPESQKSISFFCSELRTPNSELFLAHRQSAPHAQSLAGDERGFGASRESNGPGDVLLLPQYFLAPVFLLLDNHSIVK